MTTTRVTVLITTYNYGHFVAQAIDSVLSQDFALGQIQILIVDDGSTDDTAERVKKYGSRVEYFYKPNGGQASALNLGFAKARGEIVALLDADDMFLPTKLARVENAFQQDPALGMVYHPFVKWDIDSGARWDSDLALTSGNIHTAPDAFFSYVPHPTSCIAFRKAYLTPLLPIPEQIRMLADGFPVDLICFLAPVLALPEPLMTYRIHGANHYYTDEGQMPLELRKARFAKQQTLFKAMQAWLHDHGYTDRQPAVRAFLDRWILYQESYEFPIHPPGRMRFFRHLVKYNRRYRRQMTWRLRTLNTLNAFGALISGYKRYPLFGNRRAKSNPGDSHAAPR